MNTIAQSTHIFNQDELTPGQVDPEWTRADLLEQQGLFFLKDVAPLLKLSHPQVNRIAQELTAQGKDPYLEAGIKKVWNHWMIRMKVFAPFFTRMTTSKLREVDSDWDANRMLHEEGIFRLSDVVEKLPFHLNQLRHQARLHQRKRLRMGVWKDEDLRVFVVDMPVFAEWVRRTWSGDFGPGRTGNPFKKKKAG